MCDVVPVFWIKMIEFWIVEEYYVLSCNIVKIYIEAEGGDNKTENVSHIKVFCVCTATECWFLKF